jgi:DHA1 family inner membrane transport protein
VLLGLTIANVFGVPLATWLSQGFGWRSTFLVVGLLGVTTAVMVSRYVPWIAAGNASPRRELGVFRRLQVVTLLMVSVGFGGLFAVYTYVTPPCWR